jgi:hypothetical protein
LHESIFGPAATEPEFASGVLFVAAAALLGGVAGCEARGWDVEPDWEQLSASPQDNTRIKLFAFTEIPPLHMNMAAVILHVLGTIQNYLHVVFA